MVQTIAFHAAANTSSGAVCPAKRLATAQRQDLAVQALAGTDTITALAEQADVSRKFVYRQIIIAQQALAQAFRPPPLGDDHVLFYLPVTHRWLGQVVLALLLVCRSSYRGAIEFCRDCLDCSLSLGTIHNLVRAALPQARAANEQQRLDAITNGLLDEIFQTQQPVLVGVDAASTYCFLLSQEENRDAVTWGVRLLELQERGFAPAANVADFGTGLRAGHTLALPNTCCRGDVFHALQTVLPVVSALENRAYQAIAHHDALAHKAAAYQRRHGRAEASLGQKLRHAKPQAAQTIGLADDVALLARWLREDIFGVAGPGHAERLALYDFVVAELRARAPLCPSRLEPLCTFLDNHRDELLAFAEQLDRELAALATDFQVSVAPLRELLRLQSLSYHQSHRWPLEAALRQRLGERFHALSEAVRAVAEHTVRASSAVENLNSRLRNYFTLRRHLGPDYLSLLQFFLNHRRFPRSECRERVGKSPAELLTGRAHPHWLEMLGYTLFSRN